MGPVFKKIIMLGGKLQSLESQSIKSRRGSFKLIEILVPGNSHDSRSYNQLGDAKLSLAFTCLIPYLTELTLC